MPMKPKELIKLLEKAGFVAKGQNGSHRKMFNPDSKVTVSVPIHAREMKKGILSDIMKKAGLK